MNSPLHKILPYVLRPLSWIYGGITDVRNWLFDHKVFPTEEFDAPVVSIGNITVGGTGKTPMWNMWRACCHPPSISLC